MIASHSAAGVVPSVSNEAQLQPCCQHEWGLLSMSTATEPALPEPPEDTATHSPRTRKARARYVLGEIARNNRDAQAAVRELGRDREAVH